MNELKIGIIANSSAQSQELKESFLSKLKCRDLNENKSTDGIDVIVAMGGDGFILNVMHKYKDSGAKFYGLNCGTLGFLLNAYFDKPELLLEKIINAKESYLYPLKMKAKLRNGRYYSHHAFNEVYLIRQTSQAAKIKVLVNGKERLSEIVCDGLMLATPAGSTAYNFSVGGPILPLRSNVLALTPISPFRPKRWQGALLPQDSRIKLIVDSSIKRPVSAVADYFVFEDAVEVSIWQDRSIKAVLLFDHDDSLSERLMREQFSS